MLHCSEYRCSICVHFVVSSDMLCNISSSAVLAIYSVHFSFTLMKAVPTNSSSSSLRRLQRKAKCPTGIIFYALQKWICQNVRNWDLSATKLVGKLVLNHEHNLPQQLNHINNWVTKVCMPKTNVWGVIIIVTWGGGVGCTLLQTCFTRLVPSHEYI